MVIVRSTDNKYLGTEVPGSVQKGDLISLGDFVFEVDFVRTLENGNITIGNVNYQLEIKE